MPTSGFRIRAARSALLIAACVGLAFAPKIAASQQQPLVHVTWGTLRVTGEAPVFIALEKGYFKEQGLDVDVQFPGDASTIVSLLSTGRVDVLSGSPSPGFWNVVGRGVPLKIVLPIGSISGGRTPGFTSGVWLVISKQAQASGAIKTFADLRGKTIAVPGFGLSGDIVLDHALRLGGLTRKDVTLKSLSFAQIPAAISNGAVDAAIENDPFATVGAEQGLFVRWKNGAEIYPGQVAAAVVYGPSLLEKGHDVGVRLAIAFTKAARDYNEAFGPKHRNTAEIVGILTKYTTDKDPSLYPKLAWNYLDPELLRRRSRAQSRSRLVRPERLRAERTRPERGRRPELLHGRIEGTRPLPLRREHAPC